MQFFEIIIYILTIINVVFFIRRNAIKKQYSVVLLVFNALTLGLHLIFESSRWQLLPLYGAIIIFSALILLYLIQSDLLKEIKIVRVSIVSIGVLLLVISGISSYSFPVEEMPEASGEYSIGTESFVLLDSAREELYADVANRKIKIQVWYPAESTEGYELVPWLEDGKVVAQGLAMDMGLPSFVLNHTEQIMSHSYSEAPISTALDQYPLVVLSHGWSGFRNLHTDLAEELASLGYIVVGIDHTYGSVATVFSEDEVAYINRDALPDYETTPNFMEYGNTLVNTYAGDITFTLNELEQMNEGLIPSRFEGKIDMENIGLLGHSTGGGAGVTVALRDDRIKALFGMDAWVEPVSESDIDLGLDVASMFLRSGSWEESENNLHLYDVVDENSSSSYLYQIEGTTHYDFSMVYMYSPWTKTLGLTGDVEGRYLVRMLKTSITSFFDNYLKDGEEDLDSFTNDWPEMTKIK